MDIGQYLAAFLASPTGLAVKALLVGAFLVFLLGAFAALRDGTFEWRFIDSFVRSTIWGRVAPVLAVLLLGYVADEPTITGAGVIAASAVGVGMISAAIESIRQIGAPPDESAVRNVPPNA